ncbi:hypothetical protein HYY72_04695, partial [Candidatus Woesearchaeota archaeon]|nr:hypothetical protein [Candidatus Woesearchaeota archaeon]
DNPAFKSLVDLLATKISWPPWNATPNVGIGANTQVPIFVIILSWIALGTVLYVLANRIQWVQESQHRSAVTWFAFGLSGIAVTSTTFVNNLTALVDFSNALIAIVGFIVVALLLIFGVGFGGARAAWNSRGAPSNPEEQIAKIEGKRQVQAAEREADTEKKIYDAEDQGIRAVRKLLQQDIKKLGDEITQIRYLIRIAQQLETIRDQGQAGQLKAMFGKQAGVVAHNLSITNNIHLQLRQLGIRLKELEQQSASLTADIGRKIQQLERLGAGATPEQKDALDKIKKAQPELNNLEARRLGMIQSIDSTIQTTSQDINIGKLVIDASNQIYANNFYEGISNLQRALGERQGEINVMSKLDPLLNDGEEIFKSQRELMKKITELLASA